MVVACEIESARFVVEASEGFESFKAIEAAAAVLLSFLLIEAEDEAIILRKLVAIVSEATKMDA